MKKEFRFDKLKLPLKKNREKMRRKPLGEQKTKDLSFLVRKECKDVKL